MGRNIAEFSIGFGFDVHRLVEGRPLILGGIKIPFQKGLLGHSDGDVLIHAIIDAILGAMGKGDIGQYFPDTDPSLKGISSLKMLLSIKEKMHKSNVILIHLDATIVAQEPKISPFFPQIKEKIANTLDVKKDIINLKAKTTERLGYIGEGKGMAAYAVVIVKKL